jgi:hypothetical protein
MSRKFIGTGFRMDDGYIHQIEIEYNDKLEFKVLVDGKECQAFDPWLAEIGDKANAEN